MSEKEGAAPHAARHYSPPEPRVERSGRWLPSLARQQQDAAAIRALLPRVVTRLQEAGVPMPAGGKGPARQPDWLTPAAWLASPVSEGSRLLWHSLEDGRVAIWVPLVGVQDEVALTALAAAEQGIYWQDQRSEWSQLFAHYRIKLAELLLLAIGLATAYAAWTEFRRSNPRDGKLLTALGAGTLLLSMGTLTD